MAFCNLTNNMGWNSALFKKQMRVISLDVETSPTSQRNSTQHQTGKVCIAPN